MKRAGKTWKHWSDDEIKYLKEHYANTPNQIIANKLGRTLPSIQVKANHLGFKNKNHYHRISTWHYLEDNPFEKLLDWEKGYIAGMLDGEGSILIIKRKNERQHRNPEIYIQIVNTNQDVIFWIEQKLGGTSQVTRQNSQKGYLPLYSWHLSGFIPCYCLLQVLSPFLIIKKPKAQEVLLLVIKPFSP